MTIELTQEEGMALQREIEGLLGVKCKIKLKFQLTELMLRVKEKTEAGRIVIEEIFKDYGKDLPGSPGRRFLQEYADDNAKEKTEEKKMYDEAVSQKISLDYEPLDPSINDLETDIPVTNLYKLMSNKAA